MCFWCGPKVVWIGSLTRQTLQIKVLNKRITYFHIAECAADIVRMEYALALKLKKNIIPVAHEEFDWPDKCRLPEDCAVMGLNAVKYARNQWIVAMILLNCYSRMLNAVLLLDMFFRLTAR